MKKAVQYQGDWWPERDHVCHTVAYHFFACDIAIKHCKKHDLVIQAGGCVGAWPKYLRRHFYEVHTFEPSVENFALMTKNLGGLQGVHATWAALSDKAGECAIRENPKNCGDDQTVPGAGIRTVAIDSLGLNPDLIYLDIQGDEYRALMGAKETIDRCNPIIGIEIDNQLSVKGDARGLLESWGYGLLGHKGQDFIFKR